MSQAKALKMREYNTSVISHEDAYSSQALSTSNVRMTNTFRSSVLDSGDETHARLNNKNAH